MKLEINKHYTILVNIQGRKIKYTGKIISINKKEFRLETKENYGCRALTFSLNSIRSFKEIPKPKKIIPHIKKRKFTPKHKLKKPETPNF